MANAETPTRTREEKWYGGGAKPKDGVDGDAAGAGEGGKKGASEGDGEPEKKELTPAERHKQEREDMRKRQAKAFSDLHKLHGEETESMFNRHASEMTPAEKEAQAAVDAAFPGGDTDAGKTAAAPAK